MNTMPAEFTVSEAQKQAYANDGYVSIEGFLTSAQCDELTAAAERQAKGHYTNILDLHRRSRAFYELITSPGLLRGLDTVVGGRMIPIGSIFFFCKPQNPLEAGSNLHQDNYAAKSPDASYTVAAVALDDAGPENGSLIVYPGTHKLGDLPSKPSRNFEVGADGSIQKAYPIGNPCVVPPGYEPKQLRYGRGSLLFLHGLTVHGAPKNDHPTRWRRVMYMHFIKDGSPFWPGWNARRQIMDRDTSWENFSKSVREYAEALEV